MNRFPSLAAIIMVLAASGIGHAAVPTAEDFESCNAYAREAVRAGSASPKTPEPTSKDERRAAGARKEGAADPQAKVTGDGKIAGAADPQLEGMDAEGAKDPVYQAAYRTCMRKSGF